MFGAPELLIILIVAVLLLFGSKKIGDLGKSFGRFTSEYKKGKMEAEKEIKEIQKDTQEENERK